MKRMLVWFLLIAMLFTAAPLASAADPYTYSKDDVMTAVDGMGRMPAKYYNLAGVGLSVIPDISAAQAETFTKKMYTIWAFLSKYAYTYNKNKSIKDVLTLAQWTSVTNYASKLAYDYGTPAVYNVLIDFMTAAKTTALVKTAVPRSLLGIEFDEATKGEPAIVKVYTTTDVPLGSVTLENANGTTIGTETADSVSYPGTLATFNEHILTVEYPYAGRVAVRVCGVDSDYGTNYYSATVNVASPAPSSGAGTTTAAVTKLTAGKATLGTASTIRVTTNLAATNVKITDSKGAFLAASATPDAASTTATSKTFILSYSFAKSGSQTIRAYAGMVNGANIVWSKKYKTAKATISSAASNATISKVTAPSALRGEDTTISVYASTNVTRVRFFDASGNVVGFTSAFTLSGKLRVFRMTYSKDADGSYKVYAQAGNTLDWNSAKKAVTVRFVKPTMKLTSTRVRRGTNSTITVRVSSTVTEVRLYDSGKNLIGTKTAPDAFVFQWGASQSKKGKKTVYVKIVDAIGESAFIKGYVTFT